jgi:hypothetical protein
MDKNMCEKITTHPISYIMQGQTDVSARNTREHKPGNRFDNSCSG